MTSCIILTPIKDAEMVWGMCHIQQGNVYRILVRNLREGRRSKDLGVHGSTALTLWRRNYFFFNFSTPCI